MHFYFISFSLLTSLCCYIKKTNKPKINKTKSPELEIYVPVFTYFWKYDFRASVVILNFIRIQNMTNQSRRKKNPIQLMLPFVPAIRDRFCKSDAFVFRVACVRRWIGTVYAGHFRTESDRVKCKICAKKSKSRNKPRNENVTQEEPLFP